VVFSLDVGDSVRFRESREEFSIFSLVFGKSAQKTWQSLQISRKPDWKVFFPLGSLEICGKKWNSSQPLQKTDRKSGFPVRLLKFRQEPLWFYSGICNFWFSDLQSRCLYLNKGRKSRGYQMRGTSRYRVRLA
jgi:hypothetical protein